MFDRTLNNDNTFFKDIIGNVKASGRIRYNINFANLRLIIKMIIRLREKQLHK